MKKRKVFFKIDSAYATEIWMKSPDSELVKHFNLIHVNINYVGFNLELVVKSAV